MWRIGSHVALFPLGGVLGIALGSLIQVPAFAFFFILSQLRPERNGQLCLILSGLDSNLRIRESADSGIIAHGRNTHNFIGLFTRFY
jgi:hypothetical protein